MEKTTLQNIGEIIKNQGVTGILAIILWIYGSQYAETLAKIQEQIVQIKVQLASINQKYAQKSAVRDYVEQQIEKHLTQYHKNQ